MTTLNAEFLFYLPGLIHCTDNLRALKMDLHDIEMWLRESDPTRLDELWANADSARKDGVGDSVHLRGLVEISNHCRRHCLYCGIRQPNLTIQRYRMTRGEILECARTASKLGYGTLVIQSGEDPVIDTEWMRGVILSIKKAASLAVTLSLGERSDEELDAWRDAGADRYLLRFETSNRALSTNGYTLPCPERNPTASPNCIECARWATR